MFTWICPKCGREVPPAYDECPDCAPKTAQPAATARPETPPPAPEPEPPAEYGEFGAHARASAAPEPPQPVYAAPPRREYAPPQAYVEPQAPYAGSPAAAPAALPRRAGPALPTWLLAIVFALAFLGLVFGIYWLVGGMRGGSQAAPAATVESPAAKPGAQTNPLQKYIEVSGLRFLDDPKNKDKTIVKFAVTNHSEADLTGLAGNVTVWGRTQKSEEDAEGTFSFTTNIGPNETKEITAALTTKKKIYELPDWQNATADLQITAPGGASPGSPGPQ